VHEGVDRNVN